MRVTITLHIASKPTLTRRTLLHCPWTGSAGARSVVTQCGEDVRHVVEMARTRVDGARD